MTLTRKEILMAFTDDKVVQKCHEHCADWRSVTLEEYVDYPKANYRIKPDRILVNGVDCPTETPDGKFYVSVSFGKHTCYDSLYLHFNTEADAKQVFEALVLPFGKEMP